MKWVSLIILRLNELVAPLAGAWIEISKQGRNLKYYIVAPLAGAWIEISRCIFRNTRHIVAPLAGAWIEIRCIELPHIRMWSLPSRERGLKSMNLRKHEPIVCRSPRGSVD